MNHYKKLVNIFHQKIEGNRLKQFYMIQIHNIHQKILVVNKKLLTTLLIHLVVEIR
jgi:hypothetical protein